MASTIRTFMLECEEVRIPVALRGASEKKDISFDRATPEYRKIVRIDIPDPGPDASSVTIDPLRRAKGAIIQQQFDGAPKRGIWEGDTFIEIEPGEIEQIEALTTIDALTIQEFVPLDAIPWYRANASYFLAPGKDTGVGTLRIMAALRAAMEANGVAAVGKLMPKGRQKLAVVYPEHGGLMVTCLSYANTFQQVIDGAAAFDDVQANPAVAGLFGQLIEAKLAGPEALDEYRDDLIDLRADLVERVKMGESLVEDEDGEPRTKEPVPAAPSETDRLLATLEASVAEVRARKAKAKTKPRASTRKTSASKQKQAVKG